jgi:hypothetical protein
VDSNESVATFESYLLPEYTDSHQLIVHLNLSNV